MTSLVRMFSTYLAVAIEKLRVQDYVSICGEGGLPRPYLVDYFGEDINYLDNAETLSRYTQ